MSEFKSYKIKCAPFGYLKETTGFSITFDALGGLAIGSEVAAKIACELLNKTYGNGMPLFVLEEMK